MIKNDRRKRPEVNLEGSAQKNSGQAGHLHDLPEHKSDRRGRSERQQRLLDVIMARVEPVTGGELAESCGVTRQVVVHDIAVLRASGVPILSTPRGYCLQQESKSQDRYVLSMFHTPDQTEIELLTFVDYGVAIEDVLIEHPFYGELRGTLHISSRRDVQLFLSQMATADATLLSSLTGGYHLHTVECAELARLTEAIQELRKNGIQVFDEPM